LHGIRDEAVVSYRESLITQQMGESGSPSGEEFILLILISKFKSDFLVMAREDIERFFICSSFHPR